MNLFVFLFVCIVCTGNLYAQNYAPDGTYSLNTSASAAVAATAYGKVAGYIENGIYTFKVFHMLRQNVLCLLMPLKLGRG